MYLRVCGYVSLAVCVPRMPDARTLASPCAPGPRNLPPVPELSAQPQKAATAMIARWHLNRAADQSPPSLLPFHSFPLSSPSRRSDSKNRSFSEEEQELAPRRASRCTRRISPLSLSLLWPPFAFNYALRSLLSIPLYHISRRNRCAQTPRRWGEPPPRLCSFTLFSPPPRAPCHNRPPSAPAPPPQQPSPRSLSLPPQPVINLVLAPHPSSHPFRTPLRSVPPEPSALPSPPVCL